MKKNIAIVIVLLVSIVVTGSMATAKAPVLLKVAINSEPESVDPYVQLSSGIIAISHLLYDPLLRWGADRTLEPMLATSWKQTSPTTYTITLRKDVVFTSGNKFTADDVIWTAKRMKTSLDFKGIFAMISFKKIDTYTVQMITTKPYPLAVNVLEFIFPMDSKFYAGNDTNGKSKSVVSKVAGTYADTHPSGTGPFILTEREHGKRIVMKKNPKYWGVQGNVDELQLIPIREEGTRVAALLKGDVDIITPVPVQDYETLKKNKALNVFSLETDRVLLLNFNSRKGEVLADKKIREAIVLGTNIKGIADKIFKGQTSPVYQMALSYMDGYDPSNLKSRYDVEKAKKLIAEAGYSVSKPLKLTMIATNNRYTKDEDFAKAFVVMMARIGIHISLKTYPKAQYWNHYDTGEADISLIGWSSDTKDSVNYGEYILMTRNDKTGTGAYNAGGYTNPIYDALLVEANAELDKKKRDAIIKKAEAIVYNDIAFFPLFLEPVSWAAKKQVKNLGVLLNPENFIPYNEVIIE